MRIIHKEYVLLVFSFCLFTKIVAQRNGITTGLNVTYLSDWKNEPFNFFNPELGYSKGITDKLSLSSFLNVLYGRAGSKDFTAKGDVLSRLWFSNDFTLDYKLKNLILSAGPTFRYRNEESVLYFYGQPQFEVVTHPTRAHFDLGGALRAGYQFKTTAHNFLVTRLSYRLYTAGVNPLSLGAFYNFTWKKKNSR